MIKRVRVVIFIGIVLFALLLRVWQIGSNPVSLNWDEAAFGYNAYALGVDAKDELGVFLPYEYLESFGDFKPPVYAYLAVIPIKIFGLTEFAVRLPSALFGTLTVLLAYYLTKRIFFNSSQRENLALVSMAVLAISPWHINLSRGAYEANVSTFFIVTGIWLFLYAVQAKGWVLILSAVSFTLSLYTFNTARIVVPILVVFLAAAFWKELWKKGRTTAIAVVIGITLLAPLVSFLLSPQASLRFNEVNIFTDITVVERTNAQIAQDNNVFWSKLLHNRRLAYGVEYVKHYLDNFSPSFLFLDGDENFRFGTRDVGILYLYEGPFLLLGGLLLFRKREGVWWLIPLWIIIGIIPAATARETPHALRILTILPTLQILIAYGLVYSYHWFLTLHPAPILKRTVVSIGSIVVALSVFYYLYGYYVFYPLESARSWSYGYKESVEYVSSVYDHYDRFSISDIMGRPYIYYLFYRQTPPDEFRNSADVERDSFGFVHVKHFDKFYFGSNPSNISPNSGKVLYIDIAEHVPAKAKVVKKIFLPDGSHRLSAYIL